MEEYEKYLEDLPYIHEMDTVDLADSVNRLVRDEDPYGYGDVNDCPEQGFFEILRLIGNGQTGFIKRFLNNVIENSSDSNLVDEAKQLLFEINKVMKNVVIL